LVRLTDVEFDALNKISGALSGPAWLREKIYAEKPELKDEAAAVPRKRPVSKMRTARPLPQGNVDLSASNTHTMRLAGSVVQLAKAVRVSGLSPELHSDIERTLLEIRANAKEIKRILKASYEVRE